MNQIWNRKAKRIALVMLLMIVVAAGGARYFFGSAQAHRGLEFETAAVSRGRVVANVTATGTLSPLVVVQVGSQVSGRIQQILVDFNSHVTKNQVIARIDPQLLEATLQEARANCTAAQGGLDKAKAQVLEAEKQYTRAKDLAAQKLVDQADLDDATTNYDAAKAQMETAAGTQEQAMAALHQAQDNLAYATIVSPVDGVVISRNVDVGQTVAASLQAPTLFVIAKDLRQMQVDTSVAEADVGKLSPGSGATFTVDAYPNKAFHGIVRQVRNAAQVVQNVVTYDAVIDVDNPDLELKPGMTANVTFVYAQRDDVLRIPNAALRFRPTHELQADTQSSGGVAAAPQARRLLGDSQPAPGINPESSRRTVWVLRNDVPMPVAVEIGLTDGTFTEVATNELHESDRLVTEIASGSTSEHARGGGPDAFRRMF